MFSEKQVDDLFRNLVHHNGTVSNTLPAAIRLRRSLYVNRFFGIDASPNGAHPRQLYSIEHKLASVPSIMIDVVTEASRIVEFLEPEERKALKAAAQAILDRADLPLPDL